MSELNLQQNSEHMRGPCPAPSESSRERVRELIAQTKERLAAAPIQDVTHLYYEIAYGADRVGSDGAMGITGLDAEEMWKGELLPTNREMLHKMLDEYLDKGVQTGSGHFVVRPSYSHAPRPRR